MNKVRRPSKLCDSRLTHAQDDDVEAQDIEDERNITALLAKHLELVAELRTACKVRIGSVPIGDGGRTMLRCSVARKEELLRQKEERKKRKKKKKEKNRDRCEDKAIQKLGEPAEFASHPLFVCRTVSDPSMTTFFCCATFCPTRRWPNQSPTCEPVSNIARTTPG